MRLQWLRVAGVLAAMVFCVAPIPPAEAESLSSCVNVDRLYFGDTVGEKISWMYIDCAADTTVHDLDTTGVAMPLDPGGIALDPARGHVYFAQWTHDVISRAELDGSGQGTDVITTGLNNPWDIALDTAHRRMYITDFGSARLLRASLSGGAPTAMVLNKTKATKPKAVVSVVLDPIANRVYVSDDGSKGTSTKISWWSTDFKTGANLSAANATQASTNFIALDRANRAMYWTNYAASTVPQLSSVKLNGKIGTDFTTASETNRDLSQGVAVDEDLGVVYWSSNHAITETFVATKVTLDLLPLDPTHGFSSVAVLRHPQNLVKPALTGNPRRGAVLTCGRGKWEDNRPWARLYNAPRTFAYAWKRNNIAIPGTSAMLKATSAGKYVCRITATNEAGFETVASNTLTVK